MTLLSHDGYCGTSKLHELDREFLSGRRAFLTASDTRSKICTMHESLAQSSVLVPILFLFHINNLARNIPDDLLVSQFANDLAVLVQEVQDRA